MPRRRSLVLASCLGLAPAVAAAAGCGPETPQAPAPPAARSAELVQDAPAPATASPTELVRVARGIGTQEIRPHLEALADVAARSGGNRAAGTPGDRASVEYVSDRLRASGWRVEHQSVRFPFFEERRPPVVRPPGGRRLGPADARTMIHSGSGAARARVRALGVGCARAAVGPLRAGEIALLQRGTCTFRRKARIAQAEGAAGVLVVSAGRAIRGSLAAPGIRIPVLSLSRAAGARIAAAGRVRLDVATVSERRRTVNVLAEAGAGRPVTMAGAHLDSVTDGPGLNDNASGTAAVLAVAEAFAGRAPAGTRIRLAFWGAEELGLHGSRRYVRSLSRGERRAIRAYLNLDMVGTRRGTPRVYRTREGIARVLRAELRRRDRRTGATELGKASDHAPFARARIPVGGVYTGADSCYHRRCDDLGNVDARMVADVAAATGVALVRLR